eukprot:snap_masked-scaffold_47-processed-gene-1.79-mRNA-1 protein AED:1.00 eAED:1.00 QI:0/0/0/0/1/1/4/0/274
MIFDIISIEFDVPSFEKDKLTSCDTLVYYTTLRSRYTETNCIPLENTFNEEFGKEVTKKIRKLKFTDCENYIEEYEFLLHEYYSEILSSDFNGKLTIEDDIIFSKISLNDILSSQQCANQTVEDDLCIDLFTFTSLNSSLLIRNDISTDLVFNKEESMNLLKETCKKQNSLDFVQPLRKIERYAVLCFIILPIAFLYLVGILGEANCNEKRTFIEYKQNARYDLFFITIIYPLLYLPFALGWRYKLQDAKNEIDRFNSAHHLVSTSLFNVACWP